TDRCRAPPIAIPSATALGGPGACDPGSAATPALTAARPGRRWRLRGEAAGRRRRSRQGLVGLRRSVPPIRSFEIMERFARRPVSIAMRYGRGPVEEAL